MQIYYGEGENQKIDSSIFRKEQFKAVDGKRHSDVAAREAKKDAIRVA